MVKPALGVGRKIGVLTEDRFRADICGHLHEKTFLAHINVQRVERLHLSELLLAYIAFAQG
jgi:hypothetical protein